MQINFNEAPATSCPAATPGNFNVRAYYTDNDAGHLFGPFSCHQEAERCLLALAGHAAQAGGVLRAVIEPAPAATVPVPGGA